MNIVKFYGAENCSSCVKAFKFLCNNRYAVERVDIFATPPTKAEMVQMLGYYKGNIRALFNTAGRFYQENNLKDKIGKMTQDEALQMLLKNGRLVKRPFILFKGGGLVGFDPKEWKKVLVPTP